MQASFEMFEIGSLGIPHRANALIKNIKARISDFIENSILIGEDVFKETGKVSVDYDEKVIVLKIKN